MSVLASLSLFGGLVALDGTSVGQFMIARPLVACTLTGWLLGDPVTGAAVGALLELYYLTVLPVGGARFPEPGPASVVAGTAAVQSTGPGGVAAAVLLGLAVGEVGGRSIAWLRTVNGRLAPDPARGTVTARAVVGAHLAGVSLDFARGAVLTAAGLGVASLITRWATAWPLGAGATKALVLLGAALPLGTLLGSSGSRGRRALAFLVAVGFGLGFSIFVGAGP